MSAKILLRMSISCNCIVQEYQLLDNLPKYLTDGDVNVRLTAYKVVYNVLVDFDLLKEKDQWHSIINTAIKIDLVCQDYLL